MHPIFSNSGLLEGERNQFCRNNFNFKENLSYFNDYNSLNFELFENSKSNAKQYTKRFIFSESNQKRKAKIATKSSATICLHILYMNCLQKCLIIL